MASKVNILGKEENAMESHIKGNGIYQGRKLQGIARYQDNKVPGKESKRTRETNWNGQGKETPKETQGKQAGRKQAGRKKRNGQQKTQWQQERRNEKRKDRSRNKRPKAVSKQGKKDQATQW